MSQIEKLLQEKDRGVRPWEDRGVRPWEDRGVMGRQREKKMGSALGAPVKTGER